MDIKSPFPGMDPWLEPHWGDVHTRMVTYAADQIQTRLPPDLRARVEERVFLEAPEYRRWIVPDARIEERTSPPRRQGPDTTARGAISGIAVAEPLVIEAEDEPVTQRFVEIRETGRGGRLITVIEVLSPSNKRRGDGQDQYRQKREELKAAAVNVVEIDLLRQGEYVLNAPRVLVPSRYHRTYKVCVSRGAKPLRYELYPLSLREPLPAIAVPLRPGEPDVPLELQPLIDQAYRNGAYDDIDYRADPDPPLAPDHAVWADELLRGAGLR